MLKTIKYTNSSGLSLCFRNKKPYYFEKIDATGLSGNFTADTLARSVGQITTYKSVGARTVVCEFAVWLTDKKSRTDMLNEIVNLFNPVKSGTLTLVTNKATYDIECYPSAVPSIAMEDDVYNVYRFTVDFICDYPYFQQQGIISKSLVSGTNIIYSSSVPDTPVKIFISDCSNGATFQFRNSLGINSVKMLAFDGAVTIDTKAFTTIAYNGNVINKMDLSSKIENAKLTYGKNTIVLSGATSATISYYNLALGVI